MAADNGWAGVGAKVAGFKCVDVGEAKNDDCYRRHVHGETKTRQDKTTRDRVRRDKTRQDKTRQGKTQHTHNLDNLDRDLPDVWIIREKETIANLCRDR